MFIFVSDGKNPPKIEHIKTPHTHILQQVLGKALKNKQGTRDGKKFSADQVHWHEILQRHYISIVFPEVSGQSALPPNPTSVKTHLSRYNPTNHLVPGLKSWVWFACVCM